MLLNSFLFSFGFNMLNSQFRIYIRTPYITHLAVFTTSGSFFDTSTTCDSASIPFTPFSPVWTRSHAALSMLNRIDKSEITRSRRLFNILNDSLVMSYWNFWYFTSGTHCCHSANFKHERSRFLVPPWHDAEHFSQVNQCSYRGHSISARHSPWSKSPPLSQPRSPGRPPLQARYRVRSPLPHVTLHGFHSSQTTHIGHGLVLQCSSSNCWPAGHWGILPGSPPFFDFRRKSQVTFGLDLEGIWVDGPKVNSRK